MMSATTASSRPPPSTSHNHQIHTYHCVCGTHLLTTPYALPQLPVRASPSLDQARILPLPTLDDSPDEAPPAGDQYLPSLIHRLRPARKAVVVQREDGWERRRVWSCGRCGVGVGYELEGVEDGTGMEKEGIGNMRLKIVYLLEEGLVETEKMMDRDPD
ncbi:MAG: hypothetical protein HETSPECPRED_009856 [Heterodermia speciosa]|uniref:STEEP1 domain-containing protein n=1 Tax=Heterodermia speciosa TaxID=116794 RepID=A0A8H3G6T8_9LECA|nr:MAG: hypothetical protein HETSPECPRED_009856 [Heterodermia speciosa]